MAMHARHTSRTRATTPEATAYYHGQSPTTAESSVTTYPGDAGICTPRLASTHPTRMANPLSLPHATSTRSNHVSTASLSPLKCRSIRVARLRTKPSILALFSLRPVADHRGGASTLIETLTNTRITCTSTIILNDPTRQPDAPRSPTVVQPKCGIASHTKSSPQRNR